MRASKSKLGRAIAKLGIGVAGLVVVRLIVLNLPMFHDAGWIVQGKLSVMSAAVIAVDAMLLSVLVGFAIQFRAYLLDCVSEIPALGTMAASLVFLICTGIAYTDFKLLTIAWPSIKQLYVWTFFVVAFVLLAQITALLFQNQDRLAALLLRQPIPAEKHSDADDTRAALATR